MAERTVTVRLRALVDDYKRAMADAGRATDQVANQGDKWRALGQSAASVGDSLTRNVTLPIVAVGAAATALAVNFDNAFTRMQGLAGVSAAEIDGLKRSVLDLAGETGKAPQELAEALYTLRSSGLDGAQAMAALEVSAKASAAGLGDTATIADAVSSAMNAYAKSGLSAAEATDVLVATARAGKAEPAELAASMGRVLPVASQLGVTFDEVGGTLAALSLTGNDAAASSTLLTNILSKMLRPSEQAADSLTAVGLSVAEVQAMIRERGLLGTLEELRARLGDNGFVRFLEDQQAVQGALALTGDNLESTKAILDDVADSAGATDAAFSTWAESMGSKNARAWAELQATLIRLGDTIAPIAAQVAEALGAVAGAFDDLSPGVQQAVVYAGLFVAALGPILSVGGRVITAVSSMVTAVSKANDGLGRMPAAAKTAAAALGVLGIALAGLELFNRLRLDKVNDELDRLGDGIDTTSLDGAREALRKYREELDELDDREGKGRIISGLGTDLFITSGDADRNERIKELRDRIGELETAEDSLEGQQRESAAAFAGTTGEVDRMSNSVAEAVGGLEDYSAAVAAQFDPLFGMLDALQGNSEALAAVEEAQGAYNDAVARYGATSPEALAAQVALTDAQRQATGSALDVTAATAQLNAAIAANPGLLDSSKAQLATWVSQGLITQSTADSMAAQFDVTAARAVALGETDPRVDVSASGVWETLSAFEMVTTAVNNVPRDVTIRIATEVYGAAEANRFAALSDLNRRAAGGPVLGGETYLVGEHGPELLTMGARPGRVTPAGETARYRTALEEINARLASGGQIFEDFHWAGASQAVRDYNDIITREFYRSGGTLDRGQMQAFVAKELQSGQLRASEQMEALYSQAAAWMSAHMTPAPFSAPALAGVGRGYGGTTITGDIIVHTCDPPRQWLDELAWRLP